MAELSDDEAVAFAALMGCVPWQFSQNVWYLRNADWPNKRHEVELAWANLERSHGRFYFESSIVACRFACEYYQQKLAGAA